MEKQMKATYSLVFACAVGCFAPDAHALDIVEKLCPPLSYADGTLVKQVATAADASCDSSYPVRYEDTYFGIRVDAGPLGPFGDAYAVPPRALKHARKEAMYFRQWNPWRNGFTEIQYFKGIKGRYMRQNVFGRAINCFARTIRLTQAGQSIHFNSLYPEGQWRADAVCAAVIKVARK